MFLSMRKIWNESLKCNLRHRTSLPLHKVWFLFLGWLLDLLAFRRLCLPSDSVPLGLRLILIWEWLGGRLLPRCPQDWDVIDFSSTIPLAQTLLFSKWNRGLTSSKARQPLGSANFCVGKFARGFPSMNPLPITTPIDLLSAAPSFCSSTFAWHPGVVALGPWSMWAKLARVESLGTESPKSWAAPRRFFNSKVSAEPIKPLVKWRYGAAAWLDYSTFRVCMWDAKTQLLIFTTAPRRFN